ncbi:MAG: hypothetical protein ACRDNY_07140 [Gaiellaceae bacterium]
MAAFAAVDRLYGSVSQEVDVPTYAGCLPAKDGTFYGFGAEQQPGCESDDRTLGLGSSDVTSVAAGEGLKGGAEPSADLVVDALEVTQGVQDLQNDVVLVEGKRTFVRLYAHASEGFHYPTARLFVRVPGHPGDTMLRPLNSGEEALVWASRPLGPAPARDWDGTGFLFEIPSHFTRGTIELTGVVNSANDSPVETELANNTGTETVSFEAVPNPELAIYLLGYRVGGMSFSTPSSEADQLVDWLRRAYPVSDVEFRLVGGTWSRDASTSDGNLTSPNCGEVNRAIAVIEGLELGTRRGPTSARVFSQARSVGMVTDAGGFMRGCSAGIPGPIASGPTGGGTWGWDTDGSYGDWYTGHELAHTYARPHAEFCGAAGGHRYPYPFGLISPPNPVRERIYGFDIRTRDIYSHRLWTDNMTYCDRQWMSDLTYEALMRFLQDPASLGISARTLGSTSGRASTDTDPIPGPAPNLKVLSIVGAVDPNAEDAVLEPAFVVDSPGPPLQSEPGPYAIVQRGPDGVELARHRFVPHGEQSGPPAPWTGTSESGEISRLFVSEFVALAEGTLQVDLEGPPGGDVLASLRPGASAPEIELVSPKGQETLDGKSVQVSWEATDPDGDALTFVVQYRAADDKPWRSVALPTTDTSIEVPFENLPSGDAARFRVWASDGVNTTIAETAAPARVVNHPPEVGITSPNDGDVFVKGGSVALEAAGYDSDVGSLRGQSLRWSSSLDGELGSGRQLTIASLSEGTHVIQVVADDGSGAQDGTASVEVQIEVVGDVDDLPKLPDELVAGPGEILLTPLHGLGRALLMIGERNQGSVRWVARADQPWLELSSTSGSTPAAVEVSVRGGGTASVSKGEATLVIESPDLDTPPVKVQVEVPAANGGGQ